MTMTRSDERGVALVMALLMVLMVSILTTSMIVVARSETLSSLSYTSMSQVRYGAESGVHSAANYLLSSDYKGHLGSESMTVYDNARSPVRYDGKDVVLSSDPTKSNYPVAAVVNAFAAASRGTLNVNAAAVSYNARATLISMRPVTNDYTGLPVMLQTWEIEGTGRMAGAGASLVEVSAIIERQPVPMFAYAAFATHNGCDALSFAGGANTSSYDSGAPLGGNGRPVNDTTGGNVGTNGNLDGNGDPTTINGTLSTPRAGIGTCTTNNVTAATISGWATVKEDLVTLPQEITLPTPPDPNPLPPTETTSFGNGVCPSTVSPAPSCSGDSGDFTITPAGSEVTMGNVKVTAGAVVRLNAGTYVVNSLELVGNSRFVVADAGPVIIKIAGKDLGNADALDLTGNGVTNPTFDPSKLQFIYGGTGTMKITGGTHTAALVYAPNASASLHGASTDFYGAIVTNKVTATGGVSIHYDRRLQSTMMTAGNPTMSAFTWRTF